MNSRDVVGGSLACLLNTKQKTKQNKKTKFQPAVSVRFLSAVV